MPSYEAKLLDGSTIVEENLYVAGTHFGEVLAANEAGKLATFVVLLDDGSVFGVNLVNGMLLANGEAFIPPEVPPTPLRIIYYKTMRSSIGDFCNQEHTMYRVVVGWQTTVEKDGELRNVRHGISVYPGEARFEIGGDI